MGKRLGADLLYTEFTNCEALVRDVKRSLEKIRVVEEERPVAVQIYGAADQSMEAAAAVAEAANPDFIDINCGCWVKKVALREAGAGLLRNLPKFESIVRSVINGTSLPVTVKTRLGWDADNIVILDVEGPAKFRFRFAGTAVDGQGGQFLTDKYVDEIETGGLSSQNFGGLAQVVESREPSYLSGAFKAGEGLTHHFERVAMPTAPQAIP